MTKKEIVEAFHSLKEEVCVYSTKQHALIIESDNELLIGLHVPHEIVDIEADGGCHSIEVVEKIVVWTPTKPLTYKQLIKVSKIWRSLLNNP